MTNPRATRVPRNMNIRSATLPKHHPPRPMRGRNASPTSSVDPSSLSRGALTNERRRTCVSLVIAPLLLRRRRRLRSLQWRSLRRRPVRIVTIIAAPATPPCSARWPACSALIATLAARDHYERQYGYGGYGRLCSAAGAVRLLRRPAPVLRLLTVSPKPPSEAAFLPDCRRRRSRRLFLCAAATVLTDRRLIPVYK